MASDWSYNDNKHQAINARLVHDFNKEWFLTAQLQRSEAEVDLIRTFADIQPFVMPGKQSGLIAEHINYVDDYVINNAALQLNGQFELLGYTQQIVVTASHTDANRNNDYLAAPEVEGIVMLDDYSAKRIDTSKRPAFSKSTDDGLFDTTETGLAIATRFQLTDELFTIAGIKFNQYEQRIVRSARRQDVSFDENTPTHYFGVLYSISENITLYSSYTDIYRPHSEKFDINNKPLDSETGNNIELGFKSSWLNDNLYFTGKLMARKQLVMNLKRVRTSLTLSRSALDTASSRLKALTVQKSIPNYHAPY